VSKRRLYTLWLLTAIVAVALLAATLTLAARARTYRILNSTVYLTSRELTVHLHQGPDDRVGRIQQGGPDLVSRTER
jgi:hypothetical protein